MASGVKTKFKPEMIEQVKHLCRLGATDFEICDFFKISKPTLYGWIKKHPDFSGAVKEAKAAFDERVERTLAEKALGYSFNSEKVFCSNGEVTRVPVVEHVPPDTTACIFWLKNRRKEQWRDKIDHEHTGKDGGPIATDMNDRELARRIGVLLSSVDEKPAKPLH